MVNATLAGRPVRRIRVRDLVDQIDGVLRDNDRDGARELIPQLRLACEKIRRLRRLGAEYAAVGVSTYVRRVAALAGHEEEFAEFA
jgi:hypothetical protein